MNYDKDQLTPEQSLAVITSMIQQAKGNMQKNSFYYLLWGWTIVVANLGVYILIQLDIPNPYWMFLITILAAVVTIIYSFRQGKMKMTFTHLDQIHKWLWMGFGITCFIFWVFGKQIGWQINPVIMTLCGVPTFISGIMLRFKPLLIGGISFWIFGCIIFLVGSETQFLLAAIAVAIGYLVPGYLLKKSDS
jgi:hypothetical protein